MIRSFLNRRRLLGTFEIPDFTSLTPADQRRQLLDLRKKHRFSGSRVHLAVPHEDGVVRQIVLPLEVQNKLDDVVGLQMESLSPWPVDEVYWTYVKAPPAKGDRTLLVTVVVVPRTTLDAHAALFRSAGLPLRGATISVAAWAEGAAVLWGAAAPTIILGCEEGHVDGVVATGRKFFATSDSTGSDAVAGARSAVGRLMALARVPDLEGVRLVACGPTADRLPEEPSVRLPLEDAPARAGQKFGVIAAALAGISESGCAPNVLPPAMRYRQSQRQFVPAYALRVTDRHRFCWRWGCGRHSRAGCMLRGSSRKSNGSHLRSTRLPTARRGFLPRRIGLEALAGHVSNENRALDALYFLATTLPDTDWISDFTYEDGRVTISGLAADTVPVAGAARGRPLVPGSPVCGCGDARSFRQQPVHARDDAGGCPMKIRIRDRDRRALIGLALAVALYVATVELVLPQWDRLREAPELAANSESQLRRYRRAILRQGRYQELEGLVAARDSELESVLIRAESESLASVELQSIVESVAADIGVVFGERNIIAPRTLDDFFSETAMSVAFDCTPNQLVSLLAGLRDLETLITVRELNIQPAPAEGQDLTKEWQVSLTVGALIENS